VSPPRLSPRAAQVVRGAGITLMTAGVIVLLFAAYQLWGTGLQHDRAQDELAAEFDADLDAADGDVGSETTTTDARAVGGTVRTTSTTSTTLPAELVDDLASPSGGDPVARIEIPAIGVSEIVVHGVAVSDLRKGPGHYPDSAGFGEPGNAAIAGHRTTYGQPFHDLDQLEPGDRIDMTTVRGTFTYRVISHPDPDAPDDREADKGWFVVPATGVEVLDDMGDDRLTLTACHPEFSSRQRIIVTAELLDDPIEPLPVGDTAANTTSDTSPEDFGEGIDGEDDVVVPMLIWSGAFLLGLVTTVVIGARWRRWPTYAMAAPVLAVLLFFAFEQIDRYLPAY
jgi:sortase A